MTEEGKLLLQDFVERREYYHSRRKEFDAFACRESEEYNWQKMRKYIGTAVLLISIPVFAYSAPGLVRWLSIFGLILGCCAALSSRASQGEMRRLVLLYLQAHERPAADQELALRTFRGETHYSDLPQIQEWINCGLISHYDLERPEFRIDQD